MGNEIHDAKWWTTKYPFLTIKDNSVYPWLEINSTEDHWLSDLPSGWINSFGEQMCDELLNALGKYVDDFIIVQTKEKYGSIVIYWHWRDKERTYEEQDELDDVATEVYKILNKYMRMSYHTCVRCGKSATKYSEPWVLPFCSECFEEWKNNR